MVQAANNNALAARFTDLIYEADEVSQSQGQSVQSKLRVAKDSMMVDTVTNARSSAKRVCCEQIRWHSGWWNIARLLL